MKLTMGATGIMQFDLTGLFSRTFFRGKSNNRKVYQNKQVLTDNEIQKAKSADLVNSIIHELRNPLNIIMGFSEILKEEVKESKVEESVTYAEEINHAANDMNEIISDLLEVGSIASGNFSVDLTKEIDVRDLILRSLRINSNFAARRKVRLVQSIGNDVTVIRLDVKRMKQILANLISNAIKYSPENTEIKITANNIYNEGQKYLSISVIDQGFGMTEEEIKKAFERYKTIPNPNSGKVDSFGLGLPITKDLVELQKGKIEIKSELGKGSNISVKFQY